MQQGDAAGLDAYNKNETGFLATGSKIGITFYRVNAARFAIELGLFDEADAMISKAFSLMQETGELFATSDLYRLQACTSLRKSDPRSAEAQLLKALEVARQQKATLWELRAAIDLARLWQGQNKNDEAIALLRPVSRGIEEGDCEDEQTVATKLLASLNTYAY